MVGEVVGRPVDERPRQSRVGLGEDDGDFGEGWDEYEWRLRSTERKGPKFPEIPWQGENLAGKTLIVEMEQGMGDCIMFARYVDMGYKAIRAQCGIPGLASTYGVSKDRMYYEPADAAVPTENLWSTAKYLDHAPKLFEAIRTRFGFEHHILHDVHHRLTPPLRMDQTDRFLPAQRMRRPDRYTSQALRLDG